MTNCRRATKRSSSCQMKDLQIPIYRCFSCTCLYCKRSAKCWENPAEEEETFARKREAFKVHTHSTWESFLVLGRAEARICFSFQSQSDALLQLPLSFFLCTQGLFPGCSLRNWKPNKVPLRCILKLCHSSSSYLLVLFLTSSKSSPIVLEQCSGQV